MEEGTNSKHLDILITAYLYIEAWLFSLNFLSFAKFETMSLLQLGSN